MIPKIICFIFGHVRYFTERDMKTVDGHFIPIYKTFKQKECLRCGSSLSS